MTRLRFITFIAIGVVGVASIALVEGAHRASIQDLHEVAAYPAASELAADRVAAAELRHRRILLAWVGFLILGGLTSLLLLREKVMAEAGRIDVERRYSDLRSLSPVGLLRVNGAGRVIECNQWWCRETGVPQEEWASRNWWLPLHAEEQERVREIWATRVRIGRAFSFEVEVGSSAGGERRWFLTQWTPANPDPEDPDRATPDVPPANPPSAPEVWMGTVIDVSEQHGLQRQLHQAQKLEAVGNFTGGIAHDFNNLLTVILSNVAFLRMDVQSDGSHEMIDDIEVAANGGRDLIRSLLGFSRGGEMRIEELDLGSVVEAAVRLGQHMLPQGVRLEVHGAAESVAVRADPVALQQILLNLISNARDSIDGDGRITVEVSRSRIGEEYVQNHPWFEPGSYGQIAVSDTGSGMDESTVSRIFDPFFTTKEKGKGTGLGLSTLHTLVRQFGGYVHVYSEVGRGTVFRVYIPEVADRPGVEPARATRIPAGAPGPSGKTAIAASDADPDRRDRVLVVDDDPTLRRTALRLLARLGFDAEAAPSGDEALELLGAGEEFDFILSDVAMDGVSGVELLDRWSEAGWSGRFILTSGYTAREVDALTGTGRNVAFLPKPWTVADLTGVLVRTTGE